LIYTKWTGPPQAAASMSIPTSSATVRHSRPHIVRHSVVRHSVVRCSWKSSAPGKATGKTMLSGVALLLLAAAPQVARGENVVTVTDASWDATIESEPTEWMVEL
jgi:hypothetical protein